MGGRVAKCGAGGDRICIAKSGHGSHLPVLMVAWKRPPATDQVRIQASPAVCGIAINGFTC